MNALRRMSKTKGQKSRLWNHRSTMMTSLVFHPSTSLRACPERAEGTCFALCILIFVVAGCQRENEDTGLTVQMEQLTQQNEQLQGQVDQSKAENKKLKEQVQVLSGLSEDVRGENLYSIERITIGRLSGFFDKDKDGKREKMIVYVTPVDKEGDGMKATGAANVQLWDLYKADGEALLGEWDIEPDELKKFWFKTLIAVNYRLAFDIRDVVKSFDEPLTVRLTFTDYLSGKVFKDQRVIKPR